MINAVEFPNAWDKTLETQDFSHLRKYLSDDFQFENTQGEINNLEHTKSWCIAGELRIDALRRFGKMRNTSWQPMMFQRTTGHLQMFWYTLSSQAVDSLIGRYSEHLLYSKAELLKLFYLVLELNRILQLAEEC